MLGTGIGGYASYPATSVSANIEVDPIVYPVEPTYIHTTVNQCNLKGDVTAEDEDGNRFVVSGEQTFDNLKWLSHDKICYYFPEKDSVTVRVSNQSGNWARVNDNLSTTALNKPVFLTYFDHGVTTNLFNDSYEYYVLPGRSSIDEGKAALDEILTVNNYTLQCVYNVTLDMLQAVFYYAGTLTVEGVSITTNQPCVLMVTNLTSGEGSKLSVCDPTCTLSSSTVVVGNNTVNVNFPYSYVERGQTVSFDL